MLRSARVSILALVLAAATAAAADSTLLNMVMPDSTVVFGIQVKQALGSQLGQRIIAGMQANPDAAFQKFILETGFDPRRDLSEVVISSNGTGQGSGPNNVLVLARATFDTGRILAAAQKQGALVSNYNGATLLGNKNATDSGWVGLLEGSLAVAGSMDNVRRAIDARSTGGGVDPKLLARALDMSQRADIWFVTAGPISQFAGQVPNATASGAMNGDMVKAVQQASGGLRLAGSTVQIQAEAVMRSDKDAQALADVCRALGSMAQLNNNDPRAARLADMLQSLDLSTRSNVMRLSLTLEQSDLEQFFPASRHATGEVRKSH